MKTNKKTTLLVGMVGLAMAAGCGLEDSGLPGTGSAGGGGGDVKTVPVRVSLLVPQQPAALAAGCADLSSATLVIRKIDLRGYADCGTASPSPTETASPSGTASPDGTPSPTETATPSFTEDGCEVEPEIGPFLVDLTGTEVDGTLQQGILDAQLPVAHYDRVRYELHKLEEGTTSSNPAMQSMIDAAISVRIQGLDSNGQAFTFESDINERREDFVSLTIGDTTVDGIENITLVVDPSGWFGSAGACLDPSSQRDEIEARIQASLDLVDGDGI